MATNKEKTTRVILLNGTSCAGKTSVARDLSQKLSPPFETMAWDSFLAMLPSDQSITEEDRKDLVQLFMQKAAEKLDSGANLILDVVCVPIPTYKRLRDQFNEYGLLSVRLKAEPDILESREQERPDRKAGQARAQHRQMFKENPHPDSFYDLECDSGQLSVAAITQEISLYLK